jgi:hypothetical protein
MEPIMYNGTWEVVDRPYGCQPIGCKWIFKKKLRLDGTIERYKARLVAKGYIQKEGEDFFDTYSPVARLTTIRTLIVVAASYGLIIHQMDVKTTFLNGELDKEIYMDQLEGFIADGQENKVCMLIKSLYGLKQAPKQWHEKFDNTLTAVGFAVNESDTCVYYRYGGGEFDDILIFGSNLNVIEEVKNLLSSNFEMKDLCRRFETGGSLGRRVKCRRVPQPRWVGARRSAKGGRKGSRSERGRWKSRGLRVLSRAQVGCACSRGLQASTRERERAASRERLSRPLPRAAHPL